MVESVKKNLSTQMVINIGAALTMLGLVGTVFNMSGKIQERVNHTKQMTYEKMDRKEFDIYYKSINDKFDSLNSTLHRIETNVEELRKKN